MRIIVLSVVQYKEKDGIIKALTPEGVSSFTVKGLYDSKSKNVALKNQMTIADVDATDSRYRYPLIKSSTIVHSPLSGKGGLLYYAAIALLEESTEKLLQDDEKGMMFKHLEAAIPTLCNANSIWMTLLIYLANIFKATGHEFEVNRCVICGEKKDIRAFSFKEGGFICGKCIQPGMEDDLTKDQKLLLRDAFRFPDYAHASEYLDRKNAVAILFKFRDFIVDSYGATLNTISAIAEIKD